MPSNKLSYLAETLIGSEIVKLGADIKEKIRLGNKIYNFTIGDFDSAIFPIPDGLQKEIIAAYQDGFTTPTRRRAPALCLFVTTFCKTEAIQFYNIQQHFLFVW